MNKEIDTELVKLNEQLSKQNSRKYIFWNGIVTGLARAIGATFAFAIVIALLGYFIRTSNAQWVQNLIEWLNLNSYFE